MTIDNGVLAETRTWNINSMTRCWIQSDNISSWTSGVLKITVTPETGKKWFAMDMQLEKDVTVPGEFIRTVGSQIKYDTDTRLTVVSQVCDECYEEILKKSTAVGRPYIEVEPEIVNNIQEF